jgi:3'-phosphoadenosine 5'-phosphosulfate (PAPS) 3'-phosphatase
MSPDSVDEMVAANEQMAVHSKQRIIDQIRENQRMTAIYKKDREMVESIGDTLMEAMQLFSELKAETPVPYKQMVDMIEHLSLVFNFEPAR